MIRYKFSCKHPCHIHANIHITWVKILDGIEYEHPTSLTVYLKNFHDSSDICPMGFIYSIQICDISHQTFEPSHRKCPMCLMIFMNTALNKRIMANHVTSAFLAATKQLYEWYFLSVCLSIRPSHLFHHVPIIISSWNVQELLPMTKVTFMQKVKVRGHHPT